MNYKEAVAFVESLGRFRMDFGLARTKHLLALLDLDKPSYQTVHIGGTNGKGSTAAMVSAILRAAGYRVGLFTSPAASYRERFRLNEQPVEEAAVAPALTWIREAAGDELDGITFFELTTALAFYLFAEHGVDIAVFEVGLGGRFDATNVLEKPLAACITNVALEHTAYLGGTIREIAREKAGIIKPGQNVVTGCANGEALAVLKATAKESGARLYAPESDFSFFSEANGLLNEKVTVRGLDGTYQGLKLGLSGNYQAKNAALAVVLAELIRRGGFSINTEAISRGLISAWWPGRFEVIARDPLVILDGAHNPAGMQALAGGLSHLPYHKLFLVLGVLEDKDLVAMAREIVPLAEQVIITHPGCERGRDPQEAARVIREVFPGVNAAVVPGVLDAFTLAKAKAGPRDLICVTGSLYTVFALRNALIHMGGEA